MTESAVFLFALLIIKHLIADLPLQTNWMAFNKGTWLHKGGVVHAGIHGVTTLLALWIFASFASQPLTAGFFTVVFVVVFEVVVHYIIDFTKMNIDRLFKFSYLARDEETGKVKSRNITSNFYYYSLVGDQMVHVFCYVLMVRWLITVNVA